MSVLLALLAALSYGLGDFVGGVTSKRASPWAVALVVQLSGGVLVLGFSPVLGGAPDSGDLLWGLVAGIGNGFGTAFLYRGLATGRMGVVAPISGVGAALVPVVVGVATGERPTPLVWIGILAALPGIWLVAREPSAEDVTGARPTSSGALDGVLAGVGFGSLFAALAQIPEEAGFLPLALNQLVAAGVVVVVAVALRSPWVPGRTALLGVVSGVLGALATGAFLVASQGGYLTVTAVLASLYPAFTVILAAAVLREHVHRGQAVGLVLCAVAVTLVAAGPTSAEPSSAPEPEPATVREPATPPGEQQPAPTTEPLVIAVAPTERVRDVPLASAERLEARTRGRWRGHRIVTTPRELLAAAPGAIAMLPASRAPAWVRAWTVDGLDPFRRPGSYPLRTAGPTPGRVTTLTVVGDVMLGRGVPDPAAALAVGAALTRPADLTIGNLESTLSDDGVPQQPGDDSFHADPDLVRDLARAGFDAVSLANNHTGDYQERALLQTVERLQSSRVVPFGAGADLRSATRAAVLERHGLRFGFLGFNAIGETPPATPDTPGALSVRMPPRTGPLVRADLAHVTRAVRRLARRVDVVVVVPHWGGNYTHIPDPAQGLVARRLAAAGADLVAGGHPHWVQGLEWIRGTPVAHSLGNFVFDMDFMDQTMEGVTLTATFWGDELRAVELTPYRMGPRFAPRELGTARGRVVLSDVWAHSGPPYLIP
jgi:poly-gamma-glutamate capsule biosynthesis protein CapA/YwtB (metallophosphatase superfamily)/drug/metabolite transporter (DMT)-like permease